MSTPIHSSRHTRTSRVAFLRLLGIAIAAGCAEADLVTPPPTPLGPPPGKAEILITIITIGSAPDQNGYRIDLDDVTVGQVPVASTQTLTVDPGSHTILLADIADNCYLTIANPYHITVRAGGRSGVTFQFSCPLLSSLNITTATSGVNLDPDGYVLSIDGVVRDTLGLQDASHLTALRPGQYLLRLSSVAGNCLVGEGSSRVVAINEGQTVTVQFAVTCAPWVDDTPGEKLVVSARDLGSFDSNLFLMESNGNTRQRLTDDASDEMAPEFSPDGRRILYLKLLVGVRVLAVLDRASRQESTLPTQGVERAVWSPDGAGIAFSRNGRIYRMNADGSGEIALTNGGNDRDPYWSPDGSRIAFSRDYSVYVVNTDGTNLRQISGDQRTAGPWSPDGNRMIVTRLVCFDYYYYGCYYGPSPTDLAILDVDSGEETDLTRTPFQTEWSPVWSRDGQRVFFISSVSGNPDVFVIPAGGGTAVNVTNSIAREEWVSLGTVGGASTAPRVARIRRP